MRTRWSHDERKAALGAYRSKEEALKDLGRPDSPSQRIVVWPDGSASAVFAATPEGAVSTALHNAGYRESLERDGVTVTDPNVSGQWEVLGHGGRTHRVDVRMAKTSRRASSRRRRRRSGRRGSRSRRTATCLKCAQRRQRVSRTVPPVVPRVPNASRMTTAADWRKYQTFAEEFVALEGLGDPNAVELTDEFKRMVEAFEREVEDFMEEWARNAERLAQDQYDQYGVRLEDIDVLGKFEQAFQQHDILFLAFTRAAGQEEIAVNDMGLEYFSHALDLPEGWWYAFEPDFRQIEDEWGGFSGPIWKAMKNLA